MLSDAKFLFLIIPVSQFSEAELTELYYMSQYLQEQSDPYVSVFIFTKDGELTFEHEGKSYALLKAVPPVTNRSFSVGAELAEFHRKGRGFPYEVKDAGRIGQWKDLWGKRIDQLEAFWQQKFKCLRMSRLIKNDRIFSILFRPFGKCRSILS